MNFFIMYIINFYTHSADFSRSNMRDCNLTDAKLDNCVFDKTDLSNLKYGRYPDF